MLTITNKMLMLMRIVMLGEMGKVISTEIFRILLLRPNTLCAGQHDIIWLLDFRNFWIFEVSKTYVLGNTFAALQRFPCHETSAV